MHCSPDGFVEKFTQGVPPTWDKTLENIFTSHDNCQMLWASTTVIHSTTLQWKVRLCTCLSGVAKNLSCAGGRYIQMHKISGKQSLFLNLAPELVFVLGICGMIYKKYRWQDVHLLRRNAKLGTGKSCDLHLIGTFSKKWITDMITNERLSRKPCNFRSVGIAESENRMIEFNSCDRSSRETSGATLFFVFPKETKLAKKTADPIAKPTNAIRNRREL